MATEQTRRIVQAIGELAAMTSPRFPVADATLTAYAKRLRHEDPDLVEAAVEQLSTSEEAFPSMAVLLRTMDGLRLHRRVGEAPAPRQRSQAEREAIRDASCGRMAELEALFAERRREGWSEERLKQEMRRSRHEGLTPSTT